MAVNKYLDYTGLSLYDDKIKKYLKVVFKEIKTGDVVTSLEVYQGVGEDGQVPEGATPIATIGNIEGTHVVAGALRTVPANGDDPAKTYIDLFYTEDTSKDPDVSIDISSIASDLEDVKDAIGKDNEGNLVPVTDRIKEEAKDGDYGEVPDGNAVVKGDTKIPITPEQKEALENGETVVIGDTTIVKAGDTYTITVDGEDPVTGATIEEVTKVITIKEAIDRVKEEAVEDATVTITSDGTPTEGALKTYVFTQNGEEIGKIDIPKDFLVKSGSVVWFVSEGEGEAAVIKQMPAGTVITALPEGTELDTKYLALVINVAAGTAEDQTVYIKTTDLVDADALDDRLTALETAVGKDEEGNLVAVTDRIKDEAVEADYGEEVTEVTYTYTVGEGDDAEDFVFTRTDIEDGKTPADITGTKGTKLDTVLPEGVTTLEGLKASSVPVDTKEVISIKEKIESLEQELDDFVAITDPEIGALFD